MASNSKKFLFESVEHTRKNKGFFKNIMANHNINRLPIINNRLALGMEAYIIMTIVVIYKQTQ